jgi:hypothetical protein
MKLNADKRRALRLLDEAGPRGCPEVLMEMAHGFKGEMLDALLNGVDRRDTFDHFLSERRLRGLVDGDELPSGMREAEGVVM